MSEGYEDGGSSGLEIAIIGMAGRFPGARNIEEYWQNLAAGVESITYFTPEQLATGGDPPAMVAHPDYVPVGRNVDGCDLFDAAFFGITPREAEIIDPQQRLYLECVYEALEHAGYDTDRHPGAVGIYAGCRMPGYLLNVYRNPAAIATVGEFHAQVSNDKDYLATRISYKLNLGGPSVSVQTACSTALVALHFACQGLLSGETDMAVAGGVAIKVPLFQGYLSHDGDVGSHDGHVRPFDAKARGTIFGSALGAVVVKRLEDAIADGDTVWAVVKGSAINNDAAAKVGYTAPGADGQARVIRAAQIAAGVEPDTISYVEAHGTGTPMGDPIEVGALTRAFGERTDRKQFCGIGSVKSNIGHAGAAAGATGLIKTVLALRHELIPPSLLFDEPNPQIDFANSPFHVITEPTPWPRGEAPRRAGVSAFGIGGTNAHVILEEAPERAPGSASRRRQLLVLSAKTPAALDAATARLAAHLAAHAEEDLADVAYTLQVGRKEMEQRRVLVAADREDAIAALADPRRLLAGTPLGKRPRVVFLFSGHGAQHAGMGAELYRGEPVFRAALDRCAAGLSPHLGLDLREVLYPRGAATADADARLAQTALAQPALFAFEYALAQLWMSWGIAPGAMLGHSIGEYVAACLAGVMTLPAALALVAARGRLMQSQPPGAMLAVALSPAALAPLLGRQLSLAAANAAERSVVSGPEEAIAELAARLAADRVVCRRLQTSHAFHSAMMEPILAPFLAEVQKVDLRDPQIPYLSNLTGGWISSEQATDPEHWVRHLRGTVRFADGLATLFAEGDALLLEVGPGRTLASLAKQQPGRPAGAVVLSSLPAPAAGGAADRAGELPHLLATLGRLWAHGATVDWAGFYAAERRVRLALPSYPFERKHFWIDPAGEAEGIGDRGVTARKKEDLADWFYLPHWRPAPLSLAAAPPAAGARWLLFADGAGLAALLAAHLRAGGAAVSLVEPGPAFAALARDHFVVEPARRADYEALFAALRDAGELPDVVGQLWLVDGLSSRPTSGAAGGRLSDEESAAVIDRGFYSLLHIAQGLVKAGAAGRPLRIGVVGDGLHRVLPGERPIPEKAAALGPVRVIPQEHASFHLQAVDVAWPAEGADAADAERRELVELLAAELGGGGAGAGVAAGEPMVAFRSGERWVLDFQAVRVETPAPPPGGDTLAALQPRLRERGVYLVTGGLGGLGLAFAEHLARQVRARLVLVGRSPLPEREAWDAWLVSHTAGDPVSERIRRIHQLEALGAEVLAVPADVADRASMRAALAAAEERFGAGALHGVIHAAGVPGGGIVQLKTREIAERVLAPKIAGTRVLDELLAARLAAGAEPLDFLVLCSSTVAVLGGFGQVDYCAANNFLDAYAQGRQGAAAVARHTVAVDWSAWQEVGMALDAGLPAAPRAAKKPAVVRDPLHPLIDRRLSEGPEEAVFATEWSAGRHWPLAEHRILGVGALPGTTWIELARAAFALASFGSAGAVEIRDLLFESPLMVADGESREARIALARDGEGWSFRIASVASAASAAGEGGEPAWQEHARGRIVGAQSAAPAAAGGEAGRDLAALFASFEEEVDLATTEITHAEGAVSWGPRWQSIRRIARSAESALIELELPAEFAADVEQLAIHPALLDVATALGSVFGSEAYLPLAYRRIAFRRPLPARVFSHIRRADDGASRELAHFDVTLFDAAGGELMTIEGFTMKRVGEARARLQQPPAAAPEGAGRAAKAARSALAAGGMLSAEGVEVLRRVLSLRATPQVVVSPRDLAALLAQVREGATAGLGGRAGDGRAQPASHPRPDLPNAYAAPTNAFESRLAAIWQSALGIQPVGIHDNFFDLGGDSVLGIQMISRCAEDGLELTPDQLFEHQTIAELAAIVGAGERAAGSPAPSEAPFTGHAAGGLSQAELDRVFSNLERLPS